MADGFSQLQAQIARVRDLGTFARDVAPDVAVALDGELRRQIASGTGPDGSPWPLGKDGQAVLRGAGKALRVVPIGTTVFATLVGPEALHHRGDARGGVKRPILPSHGIPAPAVRAIKVVLKDRFEQHMRVK